ncbi:MAG TPA: AAA family ATPase [Steroidobacter sp.]|uniref:ATP-binding protein n=1 Tax=Steroidobacter sp. TaxID=1978227 RepID=UPI002ED9D99C
MGALQLKFIGELEVLRDGERLELPASRKTRALLAYLALNRRPFRREHLCALLWEIPDDPRGSLRWSLSKLRRLVDDAAQVRIVADRSTVAFDPAGAAIDIDALAAVAEGDLDRCPLETLEAAAGLYLGTPLEGLDLPDLPDYDAWRHAECDAVRRSQVRLLTALVRRQADDPERALPHARTLVRLDPHDERARAALVRLLIALGRDDQAEQQFKLGMRMLQEVGAQPGGELDRAWRRPAARTAAPANRSPELARPLLESCPAPASARPIGRDAEIDVITTTLSRVIEQRRCCVLVICGEPGIGKSRLLATSATLAANSGALLLESCAYESEAIRPFAVWIDALRKLDAGAADAIFKQRDHTNRDRLFDALSDAIAARASVQPVALIFDDLQWADESSAAALHYVARMNRDQPLLCVFACREDELRENAPACRALRELRQTGLLQDIKLGPLAPEALRELISASSPQANSERLSRQCSGNPLLAIELARAEAAGDNARSLGDLVQERLARFDKEGGNVLRWAAVLAPRIDAATLARVTGLDWNRIGEVLQTAARQAMLLPVEQQFRFSHDLIARGIYDSISLAQRRSMHRRVAELLEQDSALDPERAADLAHHASQSGDAGLAARAMISAGRLCLRFFANQQALALARKGLQWVAQLPAAERVCPTIELREVMMTAAPLEDWRAAAREYAELAEQALDQGALTHARRAYYMASYVNWMHGHWDGAREEILQAERAARGGDDQEHIIGMAEAARCLVMLERDLPHADAMLMEVQALAARKHLRHPAIPAALGMLRFHENRLDEAAEQFKSARILARSSGDRISEFQANEYLAMIDIERGRPEAARAYCATLIELGEKLREGSERCFARTLDALCHYAITDDATPLDPALADLRAADAKYRLAYALNRAALVDLERQKPQAAIHRATEALRCAETLERGSEVMLAHILLARAHRAANDEPACARHIAALADFEDAPVAEWTRSRAAGLRTMLD